MANEKKTLSPELKAKLLSYTKDAQMKAILSMVGMVSGIPMPEPKK